MSYNNILETERMVLRQFCLDDASFILTLVNTPSWIAFIGDKNIHSIEAAEQYLIDGPMKSYAANGFGLSAVISKETNSPIGMCGLVNRDSLEDIDIGFALLPQYTGHGYAYEVASATMHHAKHSLGIQKVIAITDPKNISSIKLINKLGLQFEKTVELGINDSALLFSPIDTVGDHK
jgi:RimJ/RimL family protein N-acetyltransferase